MTATRALLHPDAYWTESWFEQEQERLFARTWNMVGTVEDLPLRASVAGRILTVADVTTADEDGRPVSVGVWAGYVFVHLDPVAPALREWLGEFPSRIGDFHPDRLVEVARHTLELRANWKFFVENHVDVYHLWYLHAESLGAYDHRRATWQSTGPHWNFYEPPRADVDVDGAGFWRGLTPVVGVDRWGSGAHLIFPNVTLATGAGFFMTYQCTPVAPDRSIVDIRVRAETGADATAMMEMSRTVIEVEDGMACEALQSAVASPWFEVGPLAADHELPIARFQGSVLEAMA